MMLYTGDIVAVTGLPGSGKTGLMTLLAFDAMRSLNKSLAANYTIYNTDYLRIKTRDHLKLDNTVICLDEFQLLAGSREFAKAINKSLSEFVELDVRKPQNLFLYTTQDFDMVDINIRRLTSWIFDCARLTDRGITNTSIVRVYRNTRSTKFNLTSTLVLPYTRFIGLYDTYDRDVRIV